MTLSDEKRGPSLIFGPSLVFGHGFSGYSKSATAMAVVMGR